MDYGTLFVLVVHASRAAFGEGVLCLFPHISWNIGANN